MSCMWNWSVVELLKGHWKNKVQPLISQMFSCIKSVSSIRIVYTLQLSYNYNNAIHQYAGIQKFSYLKESCYTL